MIPEAGSLWALLPFDERGHVREADKAAHALKTIEIR
jgi:hypothetical protein